MKKGLIVLLLILMVIPICVKADSVSKFNNSFEDNVVLDYDIFGSNVTFASDIIFSSNVEGSNILFSNNLTYHGNSEYTYIFANNVSYSGGSKDAIIFANSVNINSSSKISRDLVIYANTVTVEGDIARDLTITANKININNAQIGGKTKLEAEEINIYDNTIISSELTYNEEAKANISNIANIGVTSTFKGNTNNKPSIIENIYSNVTILISILLVFTAAFYIIPNFFTKLEKDTKNIVRNMGYGLITLIIIPILSIILCLTIFGLPLGIILLLLYLISVFTYMIPTGYIIGNLLSHKIPLFKKAKYISGIVGILILYIITLIPYIGGIAIFLSIILSLGNIITLFFKKNKALN